MINQFKGKHGFLSNFWPAKVHFGTWEYPTVEHAYQAAKTMDLDDRKRIQEARSPGEAKRMGRAVHLRSGWEFMKVRMMYDLVREKFEPADLRKLLEDTDDQMLIEGNDWNDTFWGKIKVYGTEGETGYRGENYLGRILMNVRKVRRND